MKKIYDGNQPITRARQVRPNAKEGLPGNMFEIAVSVTGIVKLNKNIPQIAAMG